MVTPPDETAPWPTEETVRMAALRLDQERVRPKSALATGLGLVKNVRSDLHKISA